MAAWLGDGVVWGVDANVASLLPGVVYSPYIAVVTELGFRGSSFANWLWTL